MLTLFLRGVIIYLLVFLVIRLSGKRQISDLQPFDLVITLLLADLAANPVVDTSIPLLYGAVPIFALFLAQQMVSYLSMKSERFRVAVCGRPILLIADGCVQESVMREARYTLNDLFEQLRQKDVFDISDVAYAILETNGALSVLKKGAEQVPSFSDLGMKAPKATLSQMLIMDGKIHDRALLDSGRSREWLNNTLHRMGYKAPKHVLFASLSPSGELHVQGKERCGSRIRTWQTGKGTK
ncbi:MAG: DUF421 domain-containing protein [Clostridia bacterium]|nr:DUF421 domain-containing protein [Clostridia bacterium]